MTRLADGVDLASEYYVGRARGRAVEKVALVVLTRVFTLTPHRALGVGSAAGRLGVSNRCESISTVRNIRRRGRCTWRRMCSHMICSRMMDLERGSQAPRSARRSAGCTANVEDANGSSACRPKPDASNGDGLPSIEDASPSFPFVPHSGLFFENGYIILGSWKQRATVPTHACTPLCGGSSSLRRRHGPAPEREDGEEAVRRARVVESWATLRTVSPSVGLVVDEEAEARVCVRVGVGEISDAISL